MKMVTNEIFQMAVDHIANETYRRIAGTPMPDANPYEAARNRMETATNAARLVSAIAKTLDQIANDEFDAASANLRQYEVKPGIPMPEYRYPNGIPSAKLA